jgi:hypothetical protein
VNTANLQLEGLYIALSSILATVRSKGLLSADEIDAALAAAERSATVDNGDSHRSPANVEAVLFPIRLLRLANRPNPGGQRFSDLAAQIGLSKDRTPSP